LWGAAGADDKRNHGRPGPARPARGVRATAFFAFVVNDLCRGDGTWAGHAAGIKLHRSRYLPCKWARIADRGQEMIRHPPISNDRSTTPG